MDFLVSKEIKEFCQAMLDTYWDWKTEAYELTNAQKGQIIWVRNGISGLMVNNHYIPSSDQRYLHKKLKQLYAIQVKDPLNKYTKEEDKENG